MKKLYRERVRKVSTGSTLTFYSKELNPYKQLTIEQIAFLASVVADRDCYLYIQGAGYNHYLTKHPVVNGVPSKVDIDTLTIDNSEQLGFYFPSIAAGEVFEAFLTGYYQEGD